MKSFSSHAWLVPEPVLVIGTYDKEGKPNAMSAAWGGTWGYHEIVISLGSHATTDNLEANNGEFTLTFATKETMAGADYVGTTSAKSVPDKVARTGWNVEKAPDINAPLFKDFPMSMECRTIRKIDESETGYCLVAEIIKIFADENCLAEDGKPDITKMNLITFDPIREGYVELGGRVADAFAVGKELK